MVPRVSFQLAPPSFKSVAKYPLSGKLASIFKYEAMARSKRELVPDAIDVVSPGLCDDVLSYISPSLEEYKGCDIIDVHPGACLWSQKVHDHLKPRRHLLMEPEPRYYEPFIKPLLELPNSNYRHTTLSGAHPKSYFGSYDKIFDDDELMFKRRPFPQDDPRLRQPNKSLLVIGTVARRYKDSHRPFTNFVNSANMLLNHMVQASQTNTLFHGYGLVRILLWHPEETRQNVLPDMSTARSAFSTALEPAADLVEVAGQPRVFSEELGVMEKGKSVRWRSPTLDRLGADQVLEKMESQGMHMPAHRRGPIHQAAIERREQRKHKMTQAGGEVDAADVDIDAQDKAHLEFYTQLDNNSKVKSAVHKHEERVKHFVATVPNRGPQVSQVPYRYQFPEIASQFLELRTMSRLGPLMDLWREQFGVEKALAARKHVSSKKKELSELEERLQITAKIIRDMFGDPAMVARQRQKTALSIAWEDQAFHQKVLAYDRRPFEAMAVEPDEFWPRFGLYLLDIQPRSETLGDDLTTPLEANTIMREIVSILFQLSATTVVKAVDRLGANAGPALVPQVPEIADASKGGRLDVEDMVVRLLTREMIHGLTRAYLDWPFRPRDST